MTRPGKRLCVLDTNVLMHDPAALFRFHGDDLFLPMVVIEELDAAKKGLSEVAQNARQASRFLEQMIHGATRDAIHQGLPLEPFSLKSGPSASNGTRTGGAQGRLFLQTETLLEPLPLELPGHHPDHAILSVCLALGQRQIEHVVTLITKDVNLRIKAAVLGVRAEDYASDQVLEDLSLLESGMRNLPVDFWQTHGERVQSWNREGLTYYAVEGPLVSGWFPNLCLYGAGETPIEALVRETDGQRAVLELVRDFRAPHAPVWGIHARNREQNFALNLLLHPDLDFVTLLGPAGTGKTLMTLAAGLQETLEHNRFREIIMTRITVPLGEDIGFLPGTEEEKMTPWMGALLDNLEVLSGSSGSGSWGRAATQDLLAQRIKIRSLNYMRGRTFLNRYVIIDEAQNLTPKQMRALITRAGPHSKMICVGNIAQIDTPYLTETTSGLTYVVDRFKNWPYSGHITLSRGERSRLADFASQSL
jgi:PhoH-like ATPase